MYEKYFKVSEQITEFNFWRKEKGFTLEEVSSHFREFGYKPVNRRGISDILQGQKKKVNVSFMPGIETFKQKNE